eukprot:TRINITY_DN1561_c1_g2_i1.p1 TRINITY_DN1561_c1_g2~~TRINITY_DN1561_c1_g2_i1.p1  ORF type:complete len:2395 (+),score=585.41 TRINITY_DN1561_c1_g2_i1:135-7319(+)
MADPPWSDPPTPATEPPDVGYGLPQCLSGLQPQVDTQFREMVSGVAASSGRPEEEVLYIAQTGLPHILERVLRRVLMRRPDSVLDVWAEIRDTCTDEIAAMTEGTGHSGSDSLLLELKALRFERDTAKEALATQERKIQLLTSRIDEVQSWLGTQQKLGDSKKHAEAESEQVQTAGGGVSKFGDGIASGQNPQQMRKIDFYPSDYVPPHGDDVFHAVSMVRAWWTPLGVLFDDVVIDGLLQNSSMMLERHNFCASPALVVPLYVYSVSLFKSVVWAIWIPYRQSSVCSGKYAVIPDEFDLMEMEYQDGQRDVVQIRRPVMDDIVEMFRKEQAVAERMADEMDLVPQTAKRKSRMFTSTRDMLEPLRPAVPDTLSFLGRRECGQEFFCSRTRDGSFALVVRTENAFRSQSKRSPLADNVAWTVPADVALGTNTFSLLRDASFTPDAAAREVWDAERPHNLVQLPPCMVIEYIQSRRSDETLGGEMWRCVPGIDKATRSLMEDCYAAKNQQEKNPVLDATLDRLLERSQAQVDAEACGFAVAPQSILRKIVEAKREQDQSALSIRHALDVQLLSWCGHKYVCALSGTPFLMVSEEKSELTALCRTAKGFDDQPYWHINAAMRNTQLGRTRTTLEVCKHKDIRRGVVGTYVAPDPSVRAPGSGLQYLDVLAPESFSRYALHESAAVMMHGEGRLEGMTAWYSRRRWSVVWEVGRAPTVIEPPSAALFEIGGWMLAQVRPIIYDIDKALVEIRSPGQQQDGELKNYRGLANVELPRSLYDLHRVVLWGQYSSTSKDQGVAVTFASGGAGTASVFTIMGKTCRCIAPWSRFAREEEWLYPVNSLFQIRAMLTEEQQQILRKTGLQLYELHEVTELESHVIHIRGLLGNAQKASDAALNFQSQRAVQEDGILDLSLKDISDGMQEKTWVYMTSVVYDGSRECPVQTSIEMERVDSDGRAAGATTLVQEFTRLSDRWVEWQAQNDPDPWRSLSSGRASVSPSPTSPRTTMRHTSGVADALRSKGFNALSSSQSHGSGVLSPQGSAQGTAPPPRRVAFHGLDYDQDDFVGGERGAKVVRAVGALLGLQEEQLPAHVYVHARTGNKAFKVTASKPLRRWEIELRLRQTRQRDGFAVYDTGAEMMAQILRYRVPLQRVMLQRNGISALAAAKLLDAVRHNEHCVEIGLGGEQHSREEASRFSDVAITIQLRCLHNQCVQRRELLTFSQIKRVVEGRSSAEASPWPSLAAIALWDLPETLLDFDSIVDDSYDPKTGKHDAGRVAELAEFADRMFAERSLNGKTHYKAPAGALIAMARVGTPAQIARLLDVEEDPNPTDQYGETAYDKAARRDCFAQDKREGFAVLRRLQPTNSCPPAPVFSDVNQEFHRLKHFGLRMMRLESGKEGDIVDELLSSMRTPQDEGVPVCFFRTLSQYCDSLHQQKGSENPGRRPIHLLVLRMYTMSGPDVDRLAGFSDVPPPWTEPKDDAGYAQYNEKHRDSGTRNPQGMTIPLKINAPSRVLCEQTAPCDEIARAGANLASWVKFWALLNAMLDERIEYPDPSNPVLFRTIELPPSVLAAERAKKRGETFGWPACATVFFHQPTSVREPLKKVQYRIHGQDCGGHLRRISCYPKEGDVLLPALTLFVVDHVRTERGLLVVDIISRGSILATDPELRTWGVSCLVDAEAAEKKLSEACPGFSPASVALRRALLSPSTFGKREKRIDWSKCRWVCLGCMWSESLNFREHTQRDSILKSELTAFKLMEKSFGAVAFREGCSFYFSKQNALLPKSQKRLLVDRLYDIIETVSPYAFTGIKRAGHKDAQGRQVVFNNQVIHPRKIFPHTKRLGSVLLHLLGRTTDRTELVPCVPLARLQPPLMQRTDDAVEVVLNAETVDRVAAEERRRGITDRWFEETARSDEFPWPELPDGAPAREIWGDGEFRITINELKQLQRGTRVNTTAEVPLSFYTVLTKDFTSTEQYLEFFSLRRSLPLNEISNEERWKDLRRLSSERIQRAERAHAELMVRRQEVQKQIAEGHDFGNNRWGEPVDPIEIIADTDYARYVERDFVLINERNLEHFEEHWEAARELARKFQKWLDVVSAQHTDFGFTDQRHVEVILSMALVEIATSACVAQPGYFFVSGTHGNHNQITDKTPQPIIFLSAPGLDFCSAASTVLEGRKYFERLEPEAGLQAHQGFRGFKPGAEKRLKARIKGLYTAIFEIARAERVRNPSMLPMGLGVFLSNVHVSDRDTVRAAYFRAQFELLCEQDWGFHTYWINCAQHHRFARDMLEAGLVPGREFNNGSYGLQCDVVFHNRDCKFLARELAANSLSAAFLNPSDCQAIMQGMLGLYWETGRADAYVGEEDFAATSTAVVACTHSRGFGGLSGREARLADQPDWLDQSYRSSV